MKTAVKISLILALLAALAIPFAAQAQVTSYTSGFQIQNLEPVGGTVASVSIKFVSQDPAVAPITISDTINPNSSKTYYPLTQVGDGFNGSVVVESNVEIAAIANVLGSNPAGHVGAYGASYDGFTGGGSKVNLPLVMKEAYGINTWFNVQNTSSTTDATVTVAYKPGTCTETAVIKPGAAHTFDQKTNTCLLAGFVGAATIDAGTGQVVASVMQVTTPGQLKANLLAYNGFTTASTNPVMPLVVVGVSSPNAIGTGIQIQNTAASGSSDVTLTYYPGAGSPGASCTITQNIPAGESKTFGYPTMPANCLTGYGSGAVPSFIGSAKVTGNSTSAPLVGIVNQVTKNTANGGAYGAFDPGLATNQVSLPLIMDRVYGIFTGFSVANVGASTTTVNCTFTNSTRTLSATLASGAALVDVQNGMMGNLYVGSATCTATGGDAKITGVVNELTGGAPLDYDALTVYEGISY